jgi:hypothetical protein
MKKIFLAIIPILFFACGNGSTADVVVSSTVESPVVKQVKEPSKANIIAVAPATGAGSVQGDAGPPSDTVREKIKSDAISRFPPSQQKTLGDSCESFVGTTASTDFRYCWQEDINSPSGSDYIAGINKPMNVVFSDEIIEVPDLAYAEMLYANFGITLSNEGTVKWDKDTTYAVYQTMKKIPIGDLKRIRWLASIGEIREEKESKLLLTDEYLTDDVQFITGSNNTMTISTAVFENSNPKIASLDGKRGTYYSNRLHHALIHLVTEGGTNKIIVSKILLKRYGVKIDIPNYTTLTQPTGGELQSRFQDFKPSELMKIINMFEEMPSGFHKVSGLNYLVRRMDGLLHPLYPDAPAVAWTDAGYIEFMESAFKAYDIAHMHRLILHEKTHFLWSNVFDVTLKNDWMALAGWYECSENSSGWCTTKQAEFVSAYAHLKNPNEDMAESVSYFLVNPDKLRSRSILKYEFIRDRIMQGNIYISKIRDDLTFEVYNLFPDYVFPGKIKRVKVLVAGAPEEEKKITVEIDLHAMDNVLEGAAEGFLRIYSDIDTLHDMYLQPINGKSLGVTLRGTTTLSKYAKNGSWFTDQINIRDEIGNERSMGPNDFGFRVYLNNPLEDITPPKYVENSAQFALNKVTRTEPLYKGVNKKIELNALVVTWETIEENPDTCYVAINDDDFETYSHEEYGKYNSLGKCEVELLIPDYYVSGMYLLARLGGADKANNLYSVVFSPPLLFDSDLLSAGPVGTPSTDEIAPSFSVITNNPDTEAPILDLNNISVKSVPTNPDAPNGETMVTFTFKVKDNLSGYVLGSWSMRDPQGLRTQKYHYVKALDSETDAGSFIEPRNYDTEWNEWSITSVLPVGSAPGTWGIAEMTLRDRAQNFKTYDFTEIVRFDVDSD